MLSMLDVSRASSSVCRRSTNWSALVLAKSHSVISLNRESSSDLLISNCCWAVMPLVVEPFSDGLVSFMAVLLAFSGELTNFLPIIVYKIINMLIILMLIIANV